MYVSEICAEGIFVTFPWWLKILKSRLKIALFSNERHFEIWLPKKKTITFSEINYLNYTKRPNFACDNYIFPKTRGNKNKQRTHITPLKRYVLRFHPRYLASVRMSETKHSTWWSFKVQPNSKWLCVENISHRIDHYSSFVVNISIIYRDM